jgi:hypothetical protein
VKKLKLISNTKKKKKNYSSSGEDLEEEELSPRDEDNSFICKITGKCDLLMKNVFRQNPVYIIIR